MRTFFFLCLVGIVVAVVVGFAVGFIGVATEHPDGKYLVTFTINTDMICPINTTTSSPQVRAGEIGQLVDLKGKIAAIRPEKNELVVSENLKNWTFELAKDGQVFVNDIAGKLSDLQVGDEASVGFTRQGEKMVASVVRCARK